MHVIYLLNSQMDHLSIHLLLDGWCQPFDQQEERNYTGWAIFDHLIAHQLKSRHKTRKGPRSNMTRLAWFLSWKHLGTFACPTLGVCMTQITQTFVPRNSHRNTIAYLHHEIHISSGDSAIRHTFGAESKHTVGKRLIMVRNLHTWKFLANKSHSHH